ncbi:MAG: hypothetical protein OXN95_01910 [bacterium]|nr:hypothetical protein [bacterium]
MTQENERRKTHKWSLSWAFIPVAATALGFTFYFSLFSSDNFSDDDINVGDKFSGAVAQDSIIAEGNDSCLSNCILIVQMDPDGTIGFRLDPLEDQESATAIPAEDTSIPITPFPDDGSVPLITAIPDQGPPIPEGIIEIIGGEYGPTPDMVIDSGDQCGWRSLRCRYIQYSFLGMEHGTYALTCEFDGWDGEKHPTPRQFGDLSLIAFDANTVFPQQAECFINFDRLTGDKGVRIVAIGPLTRHADGTLTSRNSIASDWTKQTIQLPPRPTSP